MKIMNFIPIFQILVVLLMNIDISHSKMEFLRKDITYKHENLIKNGKSIPQDKENHHHYKPIFNFSEEFIPPNRTYEFLNLYKEISAMKGANSDPIKKAYIDNVLIPKTDAKVAKLKAETAYIESKNAARKKNMNLVKEDFEKSTPFSSFVEKLFNSSSQVNGTQILDTIYNETFYYLNNKNMTNPDEAVMLEFA